MSHIKDKSFLHLARTFLTGLGWGHEFEDSLLLNVELLSHLPEGEAPTVG